MRWTLADADSPQGALFPEDDVVDRHVGRGEFAGLEFLHVNAKTVINEVPSASHLPFRWTVNAYRGCSHACVYCQVPETPVLCGDGRHRPLGDLSVGDEIYGTVRRGPHRLYVRTEVRAAWRTTKPAHRVVLEDGTELLASGDHRYLTQRGWKFVTGTGCGGGRRPHLTTDDSLLGTGRFAVQPAEDADYRLGYLAGMIRGDDDAALERTQRFLAAEGLATAAPAVAIPRRPGAAWQRGFLAGIFDAEGSCSGGVLRIHNRDQQLTDLTIAAFRRFGFRWTAEVRPGPNEPVQVLRLLGGPRERIRFFHTTDPAIARKRSLEGVAIEIDTPLRVLTVDPLGLELPMCDITTGTGDFIADGAVSHNCFARPTHDYLGLNIGTDFDTKLVVKVNAVERLRAELKGKRWAGDHIAMGTNTDPYQRAEGKYHLTQGIVRELTRARNPFSILTKSTLILRDLDLLREANQATDVRVNLSIGTLDEATWKATEPGTPHPRQRVEAVRKLVDAGIETGVLVAPVIPGMSDGRDQLEEVVRACVDAGAVSISTLLLFLKPGVREHWMAWLRQHRPDLVPMYQRRYARGSRLPKTEQEPISALVHRIEAEAARHSRRGDG